MLKIQFMSGYNGFNFTKFTVHLVKDGNLTEDTKHETKHAKALCGKETSNVGKIGSMDANYLTLQCKRCKASFNKANK